MTGIEKLIKILESAESAIYWSSEDKNFIEKIADHLLANDVVPVVRCKDCELEGTENCPMVHKDLLFGNLYAEYKPDDFCSRGKRKDHGDDRGGRAKI